MTVDTSTVCYSSRHGYGKESIRSYEDTRGEVRRRRRSVRCRRNQGIDRRKRKDEIGAKEADILSGLGTMLRFASRARSPNTHRRLRQTGGISCRNDEVDRRSRRRVHRKAQSAYALIGKRATSGRVHAHLREWDGALPKGGPPARLITLFFFSWT